MPTTIPNRRGKPTAINAHISDIYRDPFALARCLAVLANLHLRQGLHGAAEVLAFRAEAIRKSER